MIPVATIVCSFCKRPFERSLKRIRVSNKNKQENFYCSLSCSASRLKISVTCFTCGREFERRKSWVERSKSKKLFCTRSCATTENNKLKVGDKHANWNGGKGSYRKVKPLERCDDCGESRYYLLVRHHKDRDRSNNALSNFEDLCYNCHVMRHLSIVNGKLAVNWKVLTSPEAHSLMQILTLDKRKEIC